MPWGFFVEGLAHHVSQTLADNVIVDDVGLAVLLKDVVGTDVDFSTHSALGDIDNADGVSQRIRIGLVQIHSLDLDDLLTVDGVQIQLVSSEGQGEHDHREGN